MVVAVIGSGFGRTGTMSLKSALEQLGFRRCHHMEEIFGNPDQMPHLASNRGGESGRLECRIQGLQGAGGLERMFGASC